MIKMEMTGDPGPYEYWRSDVEPGLLKATGVYKKQRSLRSD